MCGIFAYVWLILLVNVIKIDDSHWVSGIGISICHKHQGCFIVFVEVMILRFLMARLQAERLDVVLYIYILVRLVRVCWTFNTSMVASSLNICLVIHEKYWWFSSLSLCWGALYRGNLSLLPLKRMNIQGKWYYLLLHKPESLGGFYWSSLQKLLIFYLNRDSCGSFW